jgi:hypothetical protein
VYGDLTVCGTGRRFTGTCGLDESSAIACLPNPMAPLSPCAIDDWCNAGTIGDADTDRCRLVGNTPFSPCTLYTTPDDYYYCSGTFMDGACNCMTGTSGPA